MNAIWNRAKWAATSIAGLPLDFLGHASVIIGKATKILGQASKESVAGLVQKFLERIGGSPDLVDLIDRSLLLQAASVLTGRVLQAAEGNVGSVKVSIGRIVNNITELILLGGPDLLLNTAKKLAKYLFDQVIGKVGQLPTVREGIFSNEINAVTLILIRDQAAEFAKFLLDILEAAKCYAKSSSVDGEPEVDDSHGTFNELDFRNPMNRHAVICQIQRLAKSVIFILRKVDKPATLREINMTEETTLMSDASESLGSTITTEVNIAEGQPHDPGVKVRDEKWLFVNGIAGEQYWLRLACDKLKAKFGRDITGIFNRGDGLLWDIIECAGERSTFNNDGFNAEEMVSRQRTLIERTQSSLNAQGTLGNKLEEALGVGGKPTDTKVIIIAHSQGCLLLRHVLEDLVAKAVTDLELKNTMLNELCVFTFGNPSLHWKVGLRYPSQEVDEGRRLIENTDLSSHVFRTEHFANKKDFVARLGVLSDNNLSGRGYMENEVFINEERDWIGHLFGTQYSLDPGHYQDPRGQPNGQRSCLLACGNGMSMVDANGEFLFNLSIFKRSANTISIRARSWVRKRAISGTGIRKKRIGFD